MKNLKLLTISLILIIFISCSKDKKQNNNIFSENPGTYAPTNLQLNQIDQTHVYLTWDDNSEAEEGFVLEKKKDDQEWQLSYCLLEENTTDFTDCINDPNATYNYRICAYLGNDFSFYTTNSISVTFRPPSNVETEQIGVHSVQISWEDNCSEETGFRVDRKTDSEEYILNYQILQQNSMGFIDDNLTMYSNYIYRIYAFQDTTYSYCVEEELKILPFEIGSCNLPSTSMFVKEGYAYGVGGTQFSICDVSVPENPFIIGNCVIEGGVDVWIENNYAYVANSLNGFQVIDITDPMSPSLMGNHDTYAAYDICATENFVYLADTLEGLKIFDVSLPSEPVLINDLQIGNAWSVFIDNNYAYVVCIDRGLIVIDISNPFNPYEIGEIEIHGARDVFVKDNYAYICSDGVGLEIINVSIPESPLIIGSYSYSQCRKVFVKNNYAYLTGINHAKIIDISNPNIPILIFEYYFSPGSNGVSLFVENLFAYFSEQSELHIFQIEN